MTRPLRIQFPGAFYHAMARGNRGNAICLDDTDRRTFVELLGAVCGRFGWRIHAWCLMPNHYHLLIETPQANLSRGMRQLNGVFAQRTNRRHDRVGHLFQGRYDAILVQREAHLDELCRYLVLNPVRAKLVSHPTEWSWSSYRATVGTERTPEWLHPEELLSRFHHRRRQAKVAWMNFVAQGMDAEAPWRGVRHQLYLGDDGFEAEICAATSAHPDGEITREQRRALALPLTTYRSKYPDRREAMARAYLSGAYSMSQVAEHFGVHYRTVSRAVRRFEDNARASEQR